MALLLVVDDEQSLRELVSEALVSVGHEVLQAQNGAVALQMVQSGRAPDLILLDLTMPVMSGDEVVTALKADPRLSSIPVVVFTSSEVPRNDVQGKAVLHKPIELSQLLELVQTICGNDVALLHALKDGPSSFVSYPDLGSRR